MDGRKVLRAQSSAAHALARGRPQEEWLRQVEVPRLAARVNYLVNKLKWVPKNR
ncbi:MAG: hypothetical protein OEW39_08600 [Deltaproteobacteria bacterium]|nr:hypothetical protein [Deltaproteobacteria bacterium]